MALVRNPFPRSRWLPLILLLGCLVHLSQAAVFNTGPELLGIYQVNQHPRVVLRVPSERDSASLLILRKGDRAGAVEVLSIDPAQQGCAILYGNPGRPLELKLSGQANPTGIPSLDLRLAPAREFLRIYQTLSDRTVISSTQLEDPLLNLTTASGLSKKAMEEVLRARLTEAGFLFKPLGQVFVVVAPRKEEALVAKIQDPPVSRSNDDSERFPAGLLKFTETEMFQVLDVYQQLSERTIIRFRKPHAAKITILSQTELSRPEAVWLLDTAVFLSGEAIVPQGQHLAVVAPPARTNDLPRLEVSREIPEGEAIVKPVEWILSEASPSDLLQIYAKLWNRQPRAIDPSLPAVKVSLNPATPLSRREAIHALETLAWLHQLKLGPAGEKEVTLERWPGFKNKTDR